MGCLLSVGDSTGDGVVGGHYGDSFTCCSAQLDKQDRALTRFHTRVNFFMYRLLILDIPKYSLLNNLFYMVVYGSIWLFMVVYGYG